ncbi:MAG: hypothetical protein IT359_12925 [Gemmatimonadaceae bacterium]|nr:hypothetical protein [Gemmatimonadaceae bacterium]
MQTQLQLVRRPGVGYVVTEGSATIGWIRPGIVGIGGFPTRVDSYFAADAAASLLVTWSAGREQLVPVPFPHPVSADERVRLDDRVVARLVSPRDAARFAVEGFAFEIAVPNDMWLSVMLEVAQKAHGATMEWRPTALADGTPQGAA